MNSLFHYDFAQKFARRTRPVAPWIRWLNRSLLISLIGFLAYWFFIREKSPRQDEESFHPPAIQPATSAPATPLILEPSDSDNEEDSMPVREPEEKENLPTGRSAHIVYQRDTALARAIDQILRQQKPYGAFILAVDAETNEILAWGQRSDSAIQLTPTWLARSNFPAASLIKILTAAAALESGRYSIYSEIPLIGKSSTLYSRQLRIPPNYRGAEQTLLDAFAKSSNPVMGIIGQHLGGNALRRYADRLGFNKRIPFGNREASRFNPPDTGYAVAECASGFTRFNSISPLHAAALIRAFINRSAVELAWSRNIPAEFAPQSPFALSTYKFSPNTYYGMRELFLRTVSHGTARKYIRHTVYRQNQANLYIGGKTGSLDGDDPPGRYDWFAGFAQSRTTPRQALVIVVMQVHHQYRTLPSPGVAGLVINQWAKQLRR